MGPAYELPNTTNTISVNTQDDDHTYDVIPHQRSKSTNKPQATNRTQSHIDRMENTESKSLPIQNCEAPPIPPRVNNNNDVKNSNIDQGITQSLNRVPADYVKSDLTEGDYHVLEQGTQGSDDMLKDRTCWLLDGASNKPEGFYQVLELREPASGQVHDNRRSQQGDAASGGEKGKERQQEDSPQISPTNSVEWEARSPATYEVPLPKRVADKNT